MNFTTLYKKAIKKQNLSTAEALFLYEKAPLSELMFIGNELRKKAKNNSTKVGWLIDRNVNITNVCIAGCKFCNFSRKINELDTYITTLEEYKQKIDELFRKGGEQLLLQGGMHPKLGLEFYTNLFSSLKKEYPKLKLHALGPAEIHHISRKSSMSYKQVLQELIKAGLDSLPGAGAEILSERVRKIVSPAKCTAQQWLDVMEQSHVLNIPTSATMMFGYIETRQERIEHLISLRNLQTKKPEYSKGFITFVPWIYYAENTTLQEIYPDIPKITANEYLRIIAISRIILHNIENIQTSWLTVGKEIAQTSLHCGANDFGSIMLEENVVSAAGANYQFDAKNIQRAISEAGFMPCQRNQKYEFLT